MPSYKPVAEVDELVTLIYRGALEETPWQSFLEALNRRMQRQSAAITLRLSRPGMPPVFHFLCGSSSPTRIAR